MSSSNCSTAAQRDWRIWSKQHLSDRSVAATNATLSACGAPFGNQSPTVIGIPASFGSLAILLVVIRVLGRLYITKVDLDWDDYLIMAAMVRFQGDK